MANEENKQQEQAGAAPSSNVPSAAQQQSATCPKDCSKCTLAHQVYCTAKMTFDSFSVMNAIIQRIDAQSAKIAELSGRIAVIESDKTDFSAPAPVQGNLFTDK